MSINKTHPSRYLAETSIGASGKVPPFSRPRSYLSRSMWTVVSWRHLDLYTGDPYAGDPSTGDLYAGDPSVGDPSAGDPLGGRVPDIVDAQDGTSNLPGDTTADTPYVTAVAGPEVKEDNLYTVDLTEEKGSNNPEDWTSVGQNEIATAAEEGRRRKVPAISRDTFSHFKEKISHHFML